MPLSEWIRTDSVVVATFAHDPGESAAVDEWWRRTCVVFTSFGSWQVRSGRGRGSVSPRVVLVGAGSADYGCSHPEGVDDRALSINFRVDVDPGPRLLVPQSNGVQSLRRSLVTELRSTEPDHDEVDALCMALLTHVREDPERHLRFGASTRARVTRIQRLAEARYTEVDLDLVGEAAALGMSRTRFVHDFGAVVGVTPHRFVLELRTTRAARMLVETRVPVTQICFESGFGSMPRFHAAFWTAFHATPSAYRARFA